MRCVILYKQVAFDSLVDGLSAYHSGLFHGRYQNTLVDDNNLGDKLENAGCPRHRTKSKRMHLCVELLSRRQAREALRQGRDGGDR